MGWEQDLSKTNKGKIKLSELRGSNGGCGLMSWVWLPSAQEGETKRPGGQLRDSGDHAFPRSCCLLHWLSRFPSCPGSRRHCEAPLFPPQSRTNVPGTASSGHSVQEVSCGLFSSHVQSISTGGRPPCVTLGKWHSHSGLLFSHLDRG